MELVFGPIDNLLDAKWKRQVNQQEIQTFKKNIREELKSNQDFKSLDTHIEKLLRKIDGDPLHSTKCALWRGEAKGNFRIGETKVQIRRTLYQWFKEDIITQRGYHIGNLPTCASGICCNISHLVKRVKSKKIQQTPIDGFDDGFEEREFDLKNATNAFNRRRESKKKLLNEQKARIVVDRLKTGQPPGEISRSLGINYSQVVRIKRGAAWCNISNISPSIENEKRRQRRARKKRTTVEEYVRSHCNYRLNRSLSRDEAPTIIELHTFLTKTIGTFKYLVNYRKEDAPDERDCIYAHEQVRHRGKKTSSARLSYRWFVGPIPANSLVMRRCNTKKHCIRPEHLQTVEKNSQPEETDSFSDELRDGDISLSSCSSLEDDVGEIMDFSVTEKPTVEYNSDVERNDVANMLTQPFHLNSKAQYRLKYFLKKE